MYGEENIGEEEADGRLEGKHGKGGKMEKKRGGKGEEGWLGSMAVVGNDGLLV